MSETAVVGVNCYRVVAVCFRGLSVDVTTHSRAPKNTNIENLLQRVAPSTRFIETTSDHSVRYQLKSRDKRVAQELLSSLQEPRVVAIVEECALVACLDFYSHKPGNPNARTEIGGLVYQAKYGKKQGERQEAIQVLTESAVSYVADNPLLRHANGVAIIPRREQGKEAGPLLASIAYALSSELGIPSVDLRRGRTTKKAQKDIDLDKGDDPELNQRSTMVVIGNSRERVLVVDDLMRYGDSVREASRTLQTAGTTEVMALVLAKDLTGTRSYAPGSD